MERSWLLAFFSIILGSLGQVVFKMGAVKSGGFSFTPTLSSFAGLVKKIISIPELALGFLFFGASSLLWIQVLSKMELSCAYPLVSLGYILVAVLSYILFQESFSVTKIAGLLTIITGVILIGR
jgi:multidrug transporter EmrE-like cation transporter